MNYDVHHMMMILLTYRVHNRIVALLSSLKMLNLLLYMPLVFLNLLSEFFCGNGYYNALFIVDAGTSFGS